MVGGFIKAVLAEESLVEAREIETESAFDSKSEWLRKRGADCFLVGVLKWARGRRSWRRLCASSFCGP